MSIDSNNDGSNNRDELGSDSAGSNESTGDVMSALSSVTGANSSVEDGKTVSRQPANKKPSKRRRRVVPEAIQDVVAMGVGAKFDESLGGWVIPGFYKANGLLLRYDEDGDTAQATPLANKRAVQQTIKDFDDLIYLNYAWWYASRKSSMDYENPEDGWKEEFLEKEMVERKMLLIPKDKTFNPEKEQSI